jgi:hypothetical protein
MFLLDCMPNWLYGNGVESHWMLPGCRLGEPQCAFASQSVVVSLLKVSTLPVFVLGASHGHYLVLNFSGNTARDINVIKQFNDQTSVF